MRRILGIGLAVLVLALVVIVIVNSYSIDPAVPDFEAREFPSMPPSTISIPFSLPIKAIRDALDLKIPRTPGDTESWKKNVLGAKISVSGDWKVSRSDIRISGGGDGIQFGTAWNGEVRVKKVKLLSVAGTLGIILNPRLDSNWRLTPNIERRLSLRKARVAGFSVRGIIRPKLDSILRSAIDTFERSVSNDDFIEDAARQQWNEICRSFPLGSDSDSWLEVRPVAVRSAQPTVDAKNIHLLFGLDAKTRIVEAQTQPQCPFPEKLKILEEGPRTGYFKIVLPAELEYATLETFLNKTFADKTIGEDVSTTVNAVSVHPDGEAIVLGVELTMKASGWFGPWAQGTVYLSAEPRLNADRQEIILTNFQLDIESRNALVAIFGEVAEPVLLLALGDEFVFDLNPKLEEARDRAQQALNAISTDELLVEGQLSEIRLTNLDVGTDRLRIVATAQGSAVAFAKTISPELIEKLR